MNKKGQNLPGLWNVLSAVIMTMMLMLPLTLLQISQGTITIERPYLTEYEQCSSDYVELAASKTPSCAPVECRTGGTGILWSIIGAIFGLIGFGLYFYSLRKIIQKVEPTHIEYQGKTYPTLTQLIKDIEGKKPRRRK